MNKIFISLALAMLMPIISAFAQEADSVNSVANKTIHGMILDAKSKEPVIGAYVSSLNQKFNQVTDMEGHFMIEVPDTVTLLEISYLGYETKIIQFSNDIQHLQIFLNEATKSLDGVTVVGQKATTTVSTYSTMKVENIGIGELMKAACCNLSESFETTPSVDVGFTDAVSGYKQIQMLGLAGTYTSFTRENVPDIRGLAAITGLTFTPGTFVESMQLSKGAGSVVNGFEGTAGQINVEWLKPFDEKSPLLVLNGYQSTQGRSEGNLIWNQVINKKLSTSVLLHGKGEWLKVDMNKDKFLDNPLGYTFVGSNRWFYFGEKGWDIQGGFKVVNLNITGGQKDYKRGMEQLSGTNPWGYQNTLNRIETWAKIGKVYIDKPYQSMGLQLSAIYHDQANNFGATTYTAKQESYYANYIFQTIIKNSNHVIKVGGSLLADRYKENYKNKYFQRNEIVPGVFAEYNFKWLDKINIVAGLRGDYNNLFGVFATPRLHFRYAPNEKLAIRASIGRAQRTANMLAENTGLMASNRDFYFNNELIQTSSFAKYPFKPEVAWNMGVNLTKKFLLNYRDGSVNIDYYFTDFTNQVVVDFENYNRVSFYNLDGKSYSHSLQMQVDYQPVRNFDVRVAYRFYDVKTTYQNNLLKKPLVAAHRIFMNLAYTTKNQWKFDYTVQWIGAKRLPEHFNDKTNDIVSSSKTPSYWMMNTQINKIFKDGLMNIYVGAENMLNTMQNPLIMGASTPYSDKFDASMIWGSAMGWNLYVGFRMNLAKKDKSE